MTEDPVTSNAQFSSVVFENDRVRVLDYRDRPGDRTTPHSHPDSVMITLSSFERRLTAGGRQVEVELSGGVTRWLGAQEHSGENIGRTVTHTIFVELKERSAAHAVLATLAPLGPSEG